MYDIARSEYLRKHSIEVLRFWDNEVLLQIEGVLTRLEEKIPMMMKAAREMQERVYALQRFASVNATAQSPQEIYISGAVQNAVSKMTEKIRETKASIEIGNLPVIEAIDTLMVRMFKILIGNAIKFRRKDAAPRIRIYSEPLENDGRRDRYAIYVEDNGVGFEEKYLDKIFAPFQRLHGRNEYGGVGMGLAICRKIVERHGGAITARSTPGKGSTFIVTLPVSSGK